MKNKKRNKLLILLLVLLGVTIGYASLATTLKINGTTNINKNTWSVYWANLGNYAGVTPEEGDEPTIGPDAQNVPNSLIEFAVTLDQPGDFYEFQVDAVNVGSMD